MEIFSFAGFSKHVRIYLIFRKEVHDFFQVDSYVFFFGTKMHLWSSKLMFWINGDLVETFLTYCVTKIRFSIPNLTWLMSRIGGFGPFEACMSNFRHYNSYERTLTVVVHFSPIPWFKRGNMDTTTLVAPPTDGKSWTPQTQRGTKVNDHGKVIKRP